MAFTMIHENYNVSNLDTSIAFYREALGLHEVQPQKRCGTVRSSSSIWRTPPKPLNWN